jgi:hypothetical protein
MKIIKDEEAKQEILRRMQTADFQDREGVHQSDLVFCLNKAYLRKVQPIEPTESETLRWGRGVASQRYLTRKLEDEPTVELDGIQVTPDALWTDGNPWELKDTDASSTKNPLDSIHYVRQLLNQCKVLGTTVARLSLLHNMGNWKWVYRPKDPVKIQALIDEFGEDWDAHPTLSVYRFEFTQEEVDANWEQMKERRDLYLELFETGKLYPKPIALMSGMDWECDWCPYKDQCEKEAG